MAVHVQGKKTGGRITQALLKERAERCIQAGFKKQKWVEFCETLMAEGYSLRLYEARQTYSKYVTVHKEGSRGFKVRFSNHKPNKGRELEGHCHFFVGITHTGVRTTNDALRAVREHFKQEAKAQ